DSRSRPLNVMSESNSNEGANIMTRIFTITVLVLFAAGNIAVLVSDEARIDAARRSAPSHPKLNPFIQLLQFAQNRGTPVAAEPAWDRDTKADVAIALRQKFPLAASQVERFMTQETFTQLAGDDGQLDAIEIERG